MDYSTLGFSVLHNLPEFAQTHVHWISDTIQPSRLLFPSSHSGFNLSQHQGLFKEAPVQIRWPKYWSFSFSISPSKEYSGLLSFLIDWLDLLGVLETLKSLQYYNSKAAVLQCSAFFIVHLSHPFMTTGTTIALTWQTFVGKVMSLLFKYAA